MRAALLFAHSLLAAAVFLIAQRIVGRDALEHLVLVDARGRRVRCRAYSLGVTTSDDGGHW